MKFFNWMQNKFNGGQADKKHNAVVATNHTKKEPPMEEFSDRPHGLLAIGTLGNIHPREQNQEIIQVIEQQNPVGDAPQEEQCSSPDFSHFTAEEVGKLQKELTKLLSRKPAVYSSKADNHIQPPPPTVDLPLDRFLNCPSCLEVDRTVSNRFSTYSDDRDEEEIDRTIRIILGRCKDVCQKKKKKNTLGKNSLSFLVKKVFACRSGFEPSPTPSLRHTFQESTMEKLLTTMLTKKMDPNKSSTKKYVEDYRHAENEDESSRKGSKWDKTDSEYIVLEI